MEATAQLKAAEQTLALAAAEKQHPMLKQKSMKIYAVHQMLQDNSTNSTNGTNGTDAPDEEANSGAFDLTAWLDSYPDPSTWSDPMTTPFDLVGFSKTRHLPQFARHVQ